jgi:hypothetical protein
MTQMATLGNYGKRSVFFAIGLVAALSTGCSSLAERGLLPDVAARRPPRVELGAEIPLLEESTAISTSLISRDGQAHVFVVDDQKRVHYLTVQNDSVIRRTVLGSVELDAASVIDAVEFPVGEIRVSVGDKQYALAHEGKAVREIRSNRCSRLLPVGDHLFCAFVVSGKEVNAPERTDYTYGLVSIVPILYWSNERAEKLVLAQELAGDWSIRAVIDPDTELDAGADFVAGLDRHGNLHLNYFASRGGQWLLCGGVNFLGNCVSKTHTPEWRYAKIDSNALLSLKSNAQSFAPDRRKWLSIPAVDVPLRSKLIGVEEALRVWAGFRPFDRTFTLDKSNGDTVGAVWANPNSSVVPESGRNEFTKLNLLEGLWLEIRDRQNVRASDFDIVAATDLPDTSSSYGWDEPDWQAVLRTGGPGLTHAVLGGDCASTCFLAYFQKDSSGWSAPLNVGREFGSGRSLAVAESGDVFVTWSKEKGKFVGRWIRKKSGSVSPNPN